MHNTSTRHVPEPDRTDGAAPLLFQRREALVIDPRLGSTTTCQTTMASDWTPDD